MREQIRRIRLAWHRWTLACLRDERERYVSMGMVSPTYLFNCAHQEQQLLALIRELEAV